MFYHFDVEADIYGVDFRCNGSFASMATHCFRPRIHQTASINVLKIKYFGSFDSYVWIIHDDCGSSTGILIRGGASRRCKAKKVRQEVKCELWNESSRCFDALQWSIKIYYNAIKANYDDVWVFVYENEIGRLSMPTHDMIPFYLPFDSSIFYSTICFSIKATFIMDKDRCR